MFTGLIEEVGVVSSISVHPTTGQTLLLISASKVLHNVALGDSIAVDGVCLTVTSFTPNASFTVGLSPETLRRTSFAHLRPSSPVNLERSVTPSTPLGGHFVQGHVDATGRISRLEKDGDALRVVVAAPQSVLQFVVEKGYIAVDGVSLTVVRVDEGKGEAGTGEGGAWGELEVMLIQYTQAKITLPRKRVGDLVNLEGDILGKHIVAFLHKQRSRL